jgi:outer membrane lipoprotein-sorting protein
MSIVGDDRPARRACRSEGSAMKRAVLVLVFAALWVGFVLPTAARGVDVATLVGDVAKASAPGKDMRANFEFAMTNAKGETVVWTGRYYRRSVPDQRMRLVFDAPIDLRGTEVAVRPGAGRASETSIYLPSLRRVRELTADMRGESFLGTDFNYEDLGLQQLDFQQHSVTTERDREGRDCYRLESVPERGWWYGRIVRCVDRKTLLPLRTEYYDRSGELWKVRILSGIQTIKSYPTATQITMQTLPTRTLTRITLSDIEYNTGLGDALFDFP